MNRLILIGNGFDLAHQMKTSYNDFLLWYLKQSFSEALGKGYYSDHLIQINIEFPARDLKVGNATTPSELIDLLYTNGLNQLFYNNFIKIPGYGNQFTNPFKVVIKTQFMQRLLSMCSAQNWVEIENVFYEELKAILFKPGPKDIELEALNNALGHIIIQLELYLKGIDRPLINNDYYQILDSFLSEDDWVNTKINLIAKPNEIFILNFNYTSTIENYLSHLGNLNKFSKINLNYIHGKIADDKNPLVFGFGDELDSDYGKMELEKTKGFLKFIKSFSYFKTRNYHSLINFIEADNYQVFILGHSCGLSDRTMLNMIFEHNNCLSIKIFYHESEDGNNNFTELTQEISRHFKNKAEMRKKIVSFPNSKPMPQSSRKNASKLATL